MEKKLRILVVDDSVDDRALIMRMLENDREKRCTTQGAKNGDECLERLEHDSFDCVLLDYNLPARDGLHILSEIRLKWPDLPIVMLTGMGNETVAVQALKSGAQDYVPKSIISAETLTHSILTAIDRKKEEARFLYHANHDDLTGLPNRRLFTERLEHALQRSQRAGTSVGLLYMDLNGFKQVNDTMGHLAGDELLKQVAHRIAESLREYDTASRLGGDEFAVLLEDLSGNGVDQASLVAQRTIDLITMDPFVVDHQPLEIGVSLGIGLYPLMSQTVEGLFRIADQAMYDMKEAQHRLKPPLRVREPAHHGTRHTG